MTDDLGLRTLDPVDVAIRQRPADELAQAAFHANPLPMAIVTLEEGRIIELNRSFERIYGHPRETALEWTELQLELWAEPADRAILMEKLLAGTTPCEVATRMRTRAGELREMIVSAERLDLDGESCALLVTHDVTDRRRLERQLERQALHDPLTGLANRALFLDRIRQALDRTRPDAGRVTVFVFDLDRFRLVNESLGPAVGDRLLTEVGQRLRGCLRENDSAARLGGDAFGILIENCDPEYMRSIAERLGRVLEKPFDIGGKPVQLGASMGIVQSSPQVSDPDELLRVADLALSRAKGEIGTSYRFYEPALDEAAAARRGIESELWEAFHEGRLLLHYQPIISLLTGQVQGAEALLRWNHPTQGVVPAGQFIEVAEASNLTVPMGEWVMQSAIDQLDEWARKGTIADEFTLSVNLSPRQLRQPGLVDLFANMLRDRSVPPTRILLEVTEALALEVPETIRELRRLDLGVAIDDAGMGHASLESLTRLQADALKIDHTFVAALGEDPRREAIVEVLVLLGRRLGIPVVAKGVESLTQLNRLRELGCTAAQGWFFSRPTSVGMFEKLLALEPHW